MASGNLPVILIEVVLTFGGVLAFAWWQLRSVARDRRKAAEHRQQRELGAPPTDAGPPSSSRSDTP